MSYEKEKSIVSISVANGLSTALAVTLSYSVNHSIGWCILHGICGWFYVVYHVIKY